MWTVYILECSDGTLYTGSCTNLKRRLRQHDLGWCRYTRSRLPVRVMWKKGSLVNRRQAQRLEACIKSFRRKEKEALIMGDLNFPDYNQFK